MKNQIAIVGTGKIAHSFSAALKTAGYSVSLVIGKSLIHAKKFAKKFSAELYSVELTSLEDFKGLIFLAVPDSAIKEIDKQLTKLNLKWKHISVVHFSGSLTVDELKNIGAKGGKTGSLHIMQSFPTTKIVDIKNSFSAIETRNLFLKRKLFSLAKELKLIPFEIKTEQKSLYHLTGIFVSNFMVANLYLAKKLFEKTSIRDVDFIDLIRPILITTQKNILSNGIENSISGPIERGDFRTIKSHINKLKKEKAFNELNAFLIMSKSILDMIRASAGGLTEGQLLIEKELLFSIKRG
ncbi:MAG: DUF2520 domain-containing protein [Ignavibacteriaceae bacterium]|nr:DUF2520 domain-containing protein [Ignavibacteriaceae bacterium]